MFKDSKVNTFKQMRSYKKIHALLLTTGFSIQALILVLQAFKDNNRQNINGEHKWVILSIDGSSVICDLDFPVSPYASIHMGYQFASVILLTGDNVSLSPMMTVFLKKQLKKGSSLAALGLKADYLHLFHYEGAKKPWITCSHLHSVSTLVYRLLNEVQQVDKQMQRLDHRVVEAIVLMQNNTEEPLSPEELSFHLGISRRQLERLFRKHLNTSPAKYYLSVRLWEAKKMLQTSRRPLLQVGVACGFSSAAHFSRSYLQHFGISPSKEKQSCPLSVVAEA